MAEISDLKESVRNLRGRVLAASTNLQAHGKKLGNQLRQIEAKRKRGELLQLMVSHTQGMEQLARMAQKASSLFADKAYAEGLQELGRMNGLLQKCIVRQTDELGRPHAVVNALERFVPQATVQVQNAATADLDEWIISAGQYGNMIGAKLFVAATHARLQSTLRRTIAWMERSESAVAGGKVEQDALRKSSRRVMLWRLESTRMSRASTDISERSRATSASSGAWKDSFDGDDIDGMFLDGAFVKEEDSHTNASLAAFSTDALEQFMQVYEHVSMREEAVSFYRAKRLPQCNLQAITAYDLYDASETGQFPHRCRDLFTSLIGFFVLEGHVRRKVNVVAEAELKNIWKVNSEQLTMVLRMHLDSGLEFRHPRLFLDIADCVILLASMISQDSFQLPSLNESTSADKSDEDKASDDNLLGVASQLQLPVDNILDVLLRRKTRIGVAIKSYLELE